MFNLSNSQIALFRNCSTLFKVERGWMRSQPHKNTKMGLVVLEKTTFSSS